MARSAFLETARSYRCVCGAAFIIGILYWLSSIPDLMFFQEIQLPWLWRRLMVMAYANWGGNGFFSYSLSLHPDFVLHKCGHVLLYGLLGWFLYKAFGDSWAKGMLATLVFAALDEWHQSFVPGRDARFFDIVLDLLAAGGALLWMNIWRYRRNKLQKLDNLLKMSHRSGV